MISLRASTTGMGGSFRLQVMPLVLLVGSILAASPVRAQLTVNHPQDGFGTIQAAVDAAGCGGTVFLAAGGYNERVLAPCGIRLIGAGVGATIIDGTGLVEPFISQVIGFGGIPFEVSPFTEGYELARMTIRAGKKTTLLGVGIAWTRGVHLHHLEILGFSRGIAVASSTDGSIEDVHVQGPGSNPHRLNSPRCIALFEFGIFLDHLPHMTGWNIHQNVLEDCATGIDLQNNEGAVIGQNTIQRTWIGLNLLGTGGTEIHNNFIAHSEGSSAFGFPPAGISATNANASSIHHNTFCRNTAAIRYDGFGPDAFGFPPSAGNIIHHNLFSQNGEDIGFNDPLLVAGNTEFQNVNDPGFDCTP
jgi:hypothetical protein